MRFLLNIAAALLLVCLIVVSAPQPRHDSQPEVACSSGNSAPLAVCFAEGTDPDYMAEWTQRIIDRMGALDYNLGGRWSNTASGETGSQGDKVHLTYSFVPDGLNIGGDPSQLFATMNQQFGSPEVWQGVFAQVFGRWAELTGNTYEQVSDDGASWSQNSPGVLGARGDIRIAGTAVDGSSNVLAYNYFPDRGDMVLDIAENWNSSQNNFRFLRNVTMHEHGHGLGLEHVCPASSTKLLEPFYSAAYDGPQHDDILAGQRNYGDPFEPNDSPNATFDLGLIEGTHVTENASLDDNTDLDWWSFDVQANRSLTILLEPVGRTYLEGQQMQNGDCEAGTSYNTLDNQNLNFTLFAGPDTVRLVNVADRGAGFAEELFRYDVPNNVTHLKLNVWGATSNEIQLYRLTIESVDPATPYLLGCPLEIDSTLQGVPNTGAIIIANPVHGGTLTVEAVSITGPFTVFPDASFTLNPAQEQAILVTFNGEILGTQYGTLTISHNGPGPDLVCEVSGTAITSELVIFTGTTADFGDVPVQTTDSVLVGLRSTGNVSLNITSITTSAPFSLNFAGPVSLQPGPLLRLYPRVTPTQEGSAHGWLIINHSATSSPDSVELFANGTTLISVDENPLMPTEFALYQNYPNPFNPTTTIAFDLPQGAQVTLRLFNVQGQLVRELIGGASMNPGRHEISLDAAGLASGVYVYRLDAADFHSDRKLLLLK
jgi:hypothetical protein